MARLLDGIAAGTSRDWPIGETRTVGNARTLLITRTARGFAQDWADASNIADEHILRRRGLEWVVGEQGYPKLVNARFAQPRQGELLPTSRRDVPPHWQDRDAA